MEMRQTKKDSCENRKFLYRCIHTPNTYVDVYIDVYVYV